MAYFAVRGIKPAEFLSMSKLDKLFLFETMNQNIKLENEKFKALAKLMGAKMKGGGVIG